MSELLAAGKDLKNLSTTFTLQSNGTGLVEMSGDGYKPELRLAAAEVAEAVKAWTPKPAPEPKPEPAPTPPAPTPSAGLILGATAVSSWGPQEAKLFYEAGVRSERLELTGSEWTEYGTLEASVANGMRDSVVIVGNVEDNMPLAKVNIASYAKQVAEGVEKLILPTLEKTPGAVAVLELGNEMYAKTAKGWSLEGSEPAVYAELYLAALAAVKATGCPVPLIANSCGIVTPPGSGDVQWLQALAAAQPEILKVCEGFTCHPYGRAGEGSATEGSGVGAMVAQHALAVELGFAQTDFWVSESGFAIYPAQAGKEGRYVATAAEQAEQLKLYVELLQTLSWCRMYCYFQAHDFSGVENAYGLIAGSTWAPRPAFEVYSELCKAAAA